MNMENARIFEDMSLAALNMVREAIDYAEREDLVNEGFVLDFLDELNKLSVTH